MSYKTHRTCEQCGATKTLARFSSRGKVCYDCKWITLFHNDLRRAEERQAYFTERVAYIKEEMCKHQQKTKGDNYEY